MILEIQETPEIQGIQKIQRLQKVHGDTDGTEDTEDTEDTENTKDTEYTEDTEALRTTWLAEQASVRERVVEADSCSGLAGDTWSYVGGLDISFIVGDDQGQTVTHRS